MSEYSLNSDSESLSPTWNEMDKENHIQVPFHQTQNNSADGNEVDQQIDFGPLKKTLAKYKKKRAAFTSHQKSELEDAFNRNNYVTQQERFRLAVMLRLSESQIKVWFQNRRMKHKKAEVRNTLVVHTKSTSEGLLAPVEKTMPHSNQITIDKSVPTDGYNHNNNEHHPHPRYLHVPRQTVSTELLQGGPMVDISHIQHQIKHQYYTGPSHFPVQNFLITQQTPSKELVDGASAEGFSNQGDNNKMPFRYPFYFPAHDMPVYEPVTAMRGLQNGQKIGLHNGQCNGLQIGLQNGHQIGLRNEQQNGQWNGQLNTQQNGLKNGQHNGLQNGHQNGVQPGFNQYRNTAFIPSERFPQKVLENYDQDSDIFMSTYVPNVFARV